MTAWPQLLAITIPDYEYPIVLKRASPNDLNGKKCPTLTTNLTRLVARNT